MFIGCETFCTSLNLLLDVKLSFLPVFIAAAVLFRLFPAASLLLLVFDRWSISVYIVFSTINYVRNLLTFALSVSKLRLLESESPGLLITTLRSTDKYKYI